MVCKGVPTSRCHVMFSVWELLLTLKFENGGTQVVEWSFGDALFEIQRDKRKIASTLEIVHYHDASLWNAVDSKLPFCFKNPFLILRTTQIILCYAGLITAGTPI